MSKQARRPARRAPARRRTRAGLPSAPTVQYTVRSVPAHVDKALRGMVAILPAFKGADAVVRLAADPRHTPTSAGTR